MKRTLSIILAVLMLICCLPLAAGAAEESVVLTSGYIADRGYVLPAGSYSIPAGTEIVVPQGNTLYLDPGAALNVYGTLDVQGSLISRGGVLTLKISDDGKCGALKKPENAGGNSPDYYLAEVMFAELPPDFLMPEHHISDSTMFVSANGSSYDDLANEGAFTGFSFGAKYTVRLNQYLFFKMKLVDGAGVEKYDSRLLKFAFNGVGVKNEQNVNQVFVTSAGIVSFAGSPIWNEDAYLKRFNVYLPTGTGYSVFGKNGETSGAASTVTLKYGQEFLFRVDINSDYSKSAYDVYCVNTYTWREEQMISSLPDMAEETDGIDSVRLVERWAEDGYTVVKFTTEDPAKCYIDENGYYHIPAEYMVRDCSVYVAGVTKNETISLFAKLVDMIRNIFESIQAFFEGIMGNFN